MIEKILLIGVGDVGKHILEFAAREDRQFEWVIGDIDEKRAQWICNKAEIGAAHHGKHPKFRPIKIDLFDIEKTNKIWGIFVNCTITSILFSIIQWWFPISQ